MITAFIYLVYSILLRLVVKMSTSSANVDRYIASLMNEEDAKILSNFIRDSYHGRTRGNTLVIYGEGNNGKTTFRNFIAEPFGDLREPDCYKSYQFKVILNKNYIIETNEKLEIEGVCVTFTNTFECNDFTTPTQRDLIAWLNRFE